MAKGDDAHVPKRRKLLDTSAPAMSTKPTLHLTKVESMLARLLLDVARHVDESPSDMGPRAKTSEVPTVLRFTGGWVRDKLLGVLSHDIDVAINNMTGYQFGLVMNEYLEMPGNAERYHLEGVAGKLHKIAANPEKSKHLETTTTRIFDMDIDIVNLRKETYAEDSRNPQMEFGTPEDDALRRDATINALFYNLNTSEVEDFTNHGLDDMKQKLIRTPLEPYQTFKDDPLRVLRLIRFASRLDYTIAPEALEAMADDTIKAALRLKISRERVGVEVEKMLKGPRPLMAVGLIHHLGLYDIIFSDPAGTTCEPDTQKWETVYQFVGRFLADDEFRSLRSILIRNDDDRFIGWMLACTVPYLEAPEPTPNPKGKTPPHHGVSALREGIKAPNKVAEIVAAAFQNRGSIKETKDGVYARLTNQSSDRGVDPTARDTLGMSIRRWGSSWRSQVLFSMIEEVHAGTKSLDTITLSYETFVKHVESLNLLEAYALKPIINGKALMQALGLKPGQWLQGALETVMAYQLRNPDTADAADAIAQVKADRSRSEGDGDCGELTRSLIHHFLKLTVRSSFEKHLVSAGSSTSYAVDEEEEKRCKPWKFDGGTAVALLQWAARSVGCRTVVDDWGLFIPPILTLLDDHDVAYKTAGSDCLSDILRVTPSTHLQRTNLADLFEDKLLACFNYLPPSITIQQSSAMFASATATMIQQVQLLPKREPVLDRLLRQGILRSFELAGDNAKFAVDLFRATIPIVDEMQILTVKHLPSLLGPMCRTLRDPFLHAHPPLAVAGLEALRSVMRNAWPRIPAHRQEIARAITRCWVGFATDDPESDVTAGCRQTWDMLATVVEREGVDLTGEVREMIAADPRLVGLFSPSSHD